MSQKNLANEIGLPSQFFTKIQDDGSNINVVDLCKLADYFCVPVDELLISERNKNLGSKINRGKTIFKKYYEYQDKVNLEVAPDVEQLGSHWLSDISVKSSYCFSPEEVYIDNADAYNRMKEVFKTMNDVLTSIASSIDASIERKEEFRKEMINYLVYGYKSCPSNKERRILVAMANRASIALVDALQYKRLIH